VVYSAAVEWVAPWRERLSRIAASWIAVVLGTACTVAALVIPNYWHGRGSGTTRVLCAVVGLLVITVQGRAASKQVQAQEHAEAEALADARLALNDALEPVVRALATIADTPSVRERRQLVSQAVVTVLHAVTQIGPPRTRACWFEFRPGPPQQLVSEAGHAIGRSGRTTSVFREGTPAGNAALQIVRDGSVLVCEDVGAEPPPGWDRSKQRDYRTFASAGARAGARPLGMLTMDAPEPGSIKPDDVEWLKVLASALAAARAMAP
jgi:hypothetical protein